MDTVKKSFWDFKAYEENEWFSKLVKVLILIGTTYIIMHFLVNWICPKLDYEYVRLDKEQMQQISMIYLDTAHKADSTIKKGDSIEVTNNQEKLQNLKTDTLKKDTPVIVKNIKDEKIKKAINHNRINKYKISDSCDCTECTKEERVMCYLWNEFNQKLHTSQLQSIAQYLNCASTTEATNFLSKARFKVQSYFWLIGPLVYLEIIFWTWFGVICSLLFNLGVISKNSTTNPTDPTTYYDSSEVPSQVAKLMYAPACTLAIILGYNFFTDQNVVDISSSKGVLVFAFIGGFYSSRLIAFLDKLKEILLPVNSTSGTQADVPALKNIVVQVQLDESMKVLWDSLKVDLSSLKVTLQKEGSTQQAVALNIDPNQWPLFIFDFIKRGNYIIEALWNTKHDDQVINLQAKQKIEMKGSDQSVTLKLTDTGSATTGGTLTVIAGGATPQNPAEIETQADVNINKKSEDTE